MSRSRWPMVANTTTPRACLIVLLSFGLLPIVHDASAQGASPVAVDFSLTVSLTGTGSGTVTSDPPGINCRATCTANFASGTVVTLTATPDIGTGVFVPWGLDGSRTGPGPLTLTMDQAHSVTAGFQRKIVSGDFNLDGRRDLLWYHLSSGDAFVWFLDDTTPTDGS